MKRALPWAYAALLCGSLSIGSGCVSLKAGAVSSDMSGTASVASTPTTLPQQISHGSNAALAVTNRNSSKALRLASNAQASDSALLIPRIHGNELNASPAHIAPGMPPAYCPASPPRENGLVSLPPYIVEPPDILEIDTLRLVPRPPYHIEPLDVLAIVVTGTLPEQPIAGN